MKEVEHVISVLQRSIKAARNEDTVLLKELSNETIHTASIDQDEDNVTVAVLVYALSKIIERGYSFPQKEYRKFIEYYIHVLDDSVRCLKSGNCKEFSNHIQDIIKKGDSFSMSFKNSIRDVFRKAMINKASRIYEHGISMEKTAKMLDISLWELAEYSGQRNLSDQDPAKSVDVRARIKKAMEIFS